MHFRAILWCAAAFSLALVGLAHAAGSVAQITGDSLRDSRVLGGLHAQAHTADLPHDALARLQCRPEAAWFAADIRTANQDRDP